MGMTATPSRGRCLNCGADLSGAYCSACGQRVPHTDLTMRELAIEATEELVHWEGKVPRSIVALLVRPGLLTTDFLAGRRARWLPPLRLYLFCSLAFFVAGPIAESISHRTARKGAQITVTNPDGTTTLDAKSMAEIDRTFLGRWFGHERVVRAVKNNAQLNAEMAKAQPKAMFLLLPLFAGFTLLAWHRKLPRYPAHLYLALHVHAAWFAGMAIMTALTAFGPDWWAITTGIASGLYVLAYGLLSLKRVFEDSWGLTLGKSVVVGVLYFTCYFVVSAVLLLYALSRM